MSCDFVDTKPTKSVKKSTKTGAKMGTFLCLGKKRIKGTILGESVPYSKKQLFKGTILRVSLPYSENISLRERYSKKFGMNQKNQ
jgi:hypothetical protein